MAPRVTEEMLVDRLTDRLGEIEAKAEAARSTYDVAADPAEVGAYLRDVITNASAALRLIRRLDEMEDAL